MFQIKANHLQYYTFQPNNNPTSHRLSEIQSKTFEFWVQRWSSEFAKTGIPEDGWENDFFRQSFITTLWHKDLVIGCHLYTVHDLNQSDIFEEKYFSYLNPSSIDKARKLFGSNAVTMEYLCTSPLLRKNNENLSAAKLVICLGNRFVASKGLECGLGMPIDGTNVGQKASELTINEKVLESGIQKFGYKLILIAWSPSFAVNNEPPDITGYVEDIWARREDFTENLMAQTAA